MKFRLNATIAFCFLFTLLWLTLFTTATSNKTNDEWEENIDSPQQEKFSLQTNTLTNLKNDVLGLIINQFLTIQDILILRKTCNTFGNLLAPNDAGMVTFCNYFDSQHMVNVDLFWFNIKYFLNESYMNTFHEMQIYTIKEQQYAVLTCAHDQKIISWFGEHISNNNTSHYEFKNYTNDFKRKRDKKIFIPPLITIRTKLECFAQVQFMKGGIIKYASGHEKYGGKISHEILPKLKKIKMMVSSGTAFAALLDNGNVVTWGHANDGGTIPEEIQCKLKNIKTIFSTVGAFAALSNDGNVFAWGKESVGGKIPDDIQFELKKVKMIYSNDRAFIALLDNGRIFSWGDSNVGGIIPNEIQEANVKMVFTAKRAFSALLNDESVRAWGCAYRGGRIPHEEQSKLKKVKMIFSNDGAFTALLQDGSCISWGGLCYGGKIPEHLQPRLKNIKQIFPKSAYCRATFTAVCENDETITW